MSEVAAEVTSIVPVERVEERHESVAQLMRRATDVAGVCRQIVTNTAMELQGRKYVRVEGWMSIAAAYGCVPTIRSVDEDEKGNVRAVAELRRHDGSVLASAEGYVGVDEPKWARGPRYARRGMAQTRAISRVCRSVFAFCVTLIDKNLSTTPAEEIPDGETVSTAGAPKRGTAALKEKLAAPAQVEPPPPSDADAPPHVDAEVVDEPTSNGAAAPERSRRTQVRFGRSKGKHLCELEAKDLEYHLAAAKKAVEANDPKWHEHNLGWLSLVEAELARRG